MTPTPSPLPSPALLQELGVEFGPRLHQRVDGPLGHDLDAPVEVRFAGVERPCDLVPHDPGELGAVPAQVGGHRPEATSDPWAGVAQT